MGLTKNSQKMKIKSFLNKEKNIIEREKTLYHNYKKMRKRILIQKASL